MRCGSNRTKNNYVHMVLCYLLLMIWFRSDLIPGFTTQIYIFEEDSLGGPLGLSRGLCVRILVSKQGSDIDRLGLLTSIALMHATG